MPLSSEPPHTLFILFYFETDSHYIIHACLEYVILLSLPPKHPYYRLIPLCQGSFILNNNDNYYTAMCDSKVKPYRKDLVVHREDAAIFSLL